MVRASRSKLATSLNGQLHQKFLAQTEMVRETNAPPLTNNASAFWAGRVENCPGWVEFCIEHINFVYAFRAGQVENWPGRVEFWIEHIYFVYNICFGASAPKI